MLTEDGMTRLQTEIKDLFRLFDEWHRISEDKDQTIDQLRRIIDELTKDLHLANEEIALLTDRLEAERQAHEATINQFDHDLRHLGDL